jgi:hypothetical protein
VCAYLSRHGQQGLSILRDSGWRWGDSLMEARMMYRSSPHRDPAGGCIATNIVPSCPVMPMWLTTRTPTPKAIAFQIDNKAAEWGESKLGNRKAKLTGRKRSCVRAEEFSLSLATDSGRCLSRSGNRWVAGVRVCVASRFFRPCRDLSTQDTRHALAQHAR